MNNEPWTMVIHLTGGDYTLVDEDDYERLRLRNWSLCVTPQGKKYAQQSRKINGKVKTVMMHREIMNAPNGMVVDHINGDGLDNRKENLRLVQQWQNCHNRKVSVNNTSGYRGVSYDKMMKKWAASFQLKGVVYNVGHFSTREEAGAAVSEARERAIAEAGREASLIG